MTPITLEGNTLGQRHQHYNRLLKEALEEGGTRDKISHDDNDIDNFLKIDIASHNRDVNYILEVLKCKDLLYVTRAIKKSRWLIRDEKYSHIITPKYLHKEVFPHMMSKAKSKFLLHIRLQLRDEKRVAQFYNYCKQFDVKLALKWLQYCPLGFALNEVHNHPEKIPASTLKRLCRRSFDFLNVIKLEGFMNRNNYKKGFLKEVRFLLRKYPEEYLNITYDYYYYNSPFRKKHLAFIMKTCPQQILDKFDHYYDKVDYTVLVKYMDKELIKDFLLKKSEGNFSALRDHHKLLVKFLPKIELNDRIEVLKVFCYDKTSEILNWQDPNGLNYLFSELERGCPVNSSLVFRWYQCMPFDIAFREITKIIENDGPHDGRIPMINTLFICAGSNLKNLFILLKYYHETHHHESYKSKANFVNQILSRVAINKIDPEMWTLLDNLFCSMEIYNNSILSSSKYVEAIIIYNIIHDQTVPEIIQSKFKFKTLKSYKNQLSSEESEKLFNFLYKMQLKRIESITITAKKELKYVDSSLEHTMTLLADWNKNILEFTLLLQKIKECIKNYKQNNWEIDLSSLYNIQKPWRKYFFEESLMFYPSELVLLNILKHDQKMLSLYKKEVDFIRYDDTKSIQPVLSKLKIYWSDTLAKEWINEYLLHIKETGKQKVAIQSLAVLLSQRDFLSIAKQYIPKESKIDWKGTDEVDYNCHKYFAGNMHKLRPLPTVDIVLWLSKGDYLRFALTSLSTTFANHSHVDRNEYFSKLTSMQGSLQKHIINMAFAKLDVEELVPILKTIWKSTTNQTIRIIIFSTTHDLLCKQSRKSKILRLWKLLDFFIDNLSMENSIIINKMKSCLKDVPEIVRSKYCMKAYVYFQTLPNKSAIDVDGWFNTHATKVFEFLDRKFIEDLIMKTIVSFPSQSCSIKELFAKFLFSIANTEYEHETYERLVKPLFYETEYYSNFKDIVINNIPNVLREYVQKNKRVPVNLFKRLLEDFKQKLSQPEHYVALKTWELMCDFIEPMEQYISPKMVDFNEIFKTPLLSDFGKSCLKHLQKDSKIFPSILYAFGYALTDVFSMLKFSPFHQLQIYKYMLEDKSTVESYLFVQQKLLDFYDFYDDGMEELKKEIVKILCSHPSKELVMVYRHYYSNELDEDE
ncbi:hypothetical protein ABMA28_010237 [Loxostege sticticalis]|uniref:Uncharacterized protein n=1 Tax=Loxostege sticticalis TaxID=481309 RepID=A0ABD0SA59_LOXSC